MNNVVNRVAYLRTSREYPEDLHQLCVEVNKSYVDIANAVNNRIIGIFPVNRPAITGESWFLTNQRQQGLRQVFTFTFSGALTQITHGINLKGIFAFIRIFGTFTDGTNWYPLPFVEATNVTNQVGISVTPTTINIQKGATAGGTNGYIVLEWLSQV
jgi:hypothetical protein